jgi:hypothetical protein
VLLRTVFVVAFLVALAGVIVGATASLARAQVHRRAAIAADASFAQAVAATQAGIASAIAGGADSRNLTFVPPSTPPACAAVDAGGKCALNVTTSIDNTTTQPIATSADAAACTPLCAQNIQGNDAIGEGRLAVRVRAAVSGASGEIFAARDRYAIFRTLRLPPYAALIGTRDATSETIGIGNMEGADAGVPALSTIDVRYVNAATGASLDANAWQTRGWDAASRSGTAWEP